MVEKCVASRRLKDLSLARMCAQAWRQGSQDGLGLRAALADRAYPLMAHATATDEYASQSFWKTVDTSVGGTVEIFSDLWDHNVQRAFSPSLREPVVRRTDPLRFQSRVPLSSWSMRILRSCRARVSVLSPRQADFC